MTTQDVVATRIYLSPPHMSRHERGLLLDAFDSNWVAPLGPHVDAFEREFAEKIGVARRRPYHRERLPCTWRSR